MADPPIEQMRTPEALRYQRRAVVAERVGWGLMAVLIVAAMAGLLGPGPLSTARASTDDERLVVDYARFVRNGSTTAIDVRLTVEDPSVSPRLRFGTDLLASYTIESVQPSPDRVVARGDETEFVFASPQGASTITLSFRLRADGMGPGSGTVRSADATIDITQFIYP